MGFFRQVWKGLKRVLEAFGNLVSAVILTVFYFTLFALFAIPFRWFSDALGIKRKDSQFHSPRKTFTALADFETES